MQMKNLFVVSSALTFALAIILISALSVSRSQVKAQSVSPEVTKIINILEKSATTAGETKEGTPAAQQAQVSGKTDYYLPYPGILPDHPLYWLKMARDRVMLFLSQEPTQKFEKLLLFADKRVGAAKVLIEGGKVQLGVTTATKAEKYLEQAVTQFYQLEKIGKTTPELKSRLWKAASKHDEVLTELLPKVSDTEKQILEQARQKATLAAEKLK